MQNEKPLVVQNGKSALANITLDAALVMERDLNKLLQTADFFLSTEIKYTGTKKMEPWIGTCFQRYKYVHVGS